MPKIDYKEKFLKAEAEGFKKQVQSLKEENLFLREIIRSLTPKGEGAISSPEAIQPRKIENLDRHLMEIMTGEYNGTSSENGLVGNGSPDTLEIN